MNARPGEGSVRIEDGHQLESNRTDILDRRGRPHQDPGLVRAGGVALAGSQPDVNGGHVPGPLGHPLRAASLDAERSSTAVRAGARRPAHAARCRAPFGHDGSVTPRAFRGLAAGPAHSGHPVPSSGDHQSGRTGLLQQRGKPRGSILRLRRRRLHEGSRRPLGRSGRPRHPDRPLLDRRGGLDRGRERGEDARRPLQPSSGHGHLSHVVVGRPILAVGRVHLPADPDQAEVPEGREDPRPACHHHVVAALSDLQPRSIPGPGVTAEKGDRASAERL